VIAKEPAHAQAVARDRIEMADATEERDLVTGAAQHRTDDRADRARTRDQNWPRTHLPNNNFRARRMECLPRLRAHSLRSRN
jgi:hypothetical protein